MTIPAFPLSWPDGWGRLKSYRRLRSQHHPDRPGGTGEMFQRIQKAYTEATAS